MITDDGLLIMLEAAVSRPMILRLYAGKDFAEVRNTEPAAYRLKDWSINQGELLARGRRHRFVFTAAAGKVEGWVLITRDENVVFAHERFKEPYPINGEGDVIAVAPVLRAGRL